ncbi:MAG: hypothetical protein WA005_05105 [Candidatus Binataceae bacterium]
MNGYQYMIERNRLMYKLEDELNKLVGLPEEQGQAEKRRLEAEFDRQLAALYAKVSSEFPGERRKKARPIGDPR